MYNNKFFESKNISQSASNFGNEEKSGLSTFKIAATYIGTVVGAGFASGQEVLQFFGYYGLNGFLGLTITTIIFIIFGYIILRLGLEYQANSHLEVIRYGGGKWLGLVIDYIITIFLFGALTAMIAGSGAIFQEQFGIPSFWGNIIMIIASLSTTITGISGVITAISFVVPLLLIGVLSLATLTVFNSIPFDLSVINYTLPAAAPVPNWFLSAIVYASYNLIIAVAVLAPLGSNVTQEKKLKNGSFLGGLGLGLGAGAILLALLLNMPAAGSYEIPMVYIAGRFKPWIQLIYSGILLAEIYTTAVGNQFGFVARLTNNHSGRYRIYIIITSIFALIASQLGFSRLVHYLYPAVGYAGFLLIIGLTVAMIKEKIAK